MDIILFPFAVRTEKTSFLGTRLASLACPSVLPSLIELQNASSVRGAVLAAAKMSVSVSWM